MTDYRNLTVFFSSKNLQEVILKFVSAGLTAETRGPAGAFVEGQESEARQQLFGKIAPVYDQVITASTRAWVIAFLPLKRWQQVITDLICVLQLNNMLSLGQHRVWKRMAIKWSGAQPGHAAVDLCCGSGDLAFNLAEAVGSSGQVLTTFRLSGHRALL